MTFWVLFHIINQNWCTNKKKHSFSRIKQKAIEKIYKFLLSGLIKTLNYLVYCVIILYVDKMLETLNSYIFVLVLLTLKCGSGDFYLVLW